MTSAGLIQAIRSLKAEKRRPTDDDRPPPSTFRDRDIPYIAGQLELGLDDEHHEEEEASDAA